MYGEFNKISAKEMCIIAQKSRVEHHNQWLASIQHTIYEKANEGWMSYTFECGGENNFNELRKIYEPLGYDVELSYTDDGEPQATISWDKE